MIYLTWILNSIASIKPWVESHNLDRKKKDFFYSKREAYSNAWQKLFNKLIFISIKVDWKGRERPIFKCKSNWYQYINVDKLIFAIIYVLHMWANLLLETCKSKEIWFSEFFVKVSSLIVKCQAKENHQSRISWSKE